MPKGRDNRDNIGRQNVARQATGDEHLVVGLFQDQGQAERAINALKDAGFNEDQLGVALRDRSEQKELMERTETKAAEGASAGAVTGGVVGGTVGLLGGLGALMVPGLGPIFAAGWLASTLTGAGVGAAAGGLIGGLIGMGIPEEDARHFETGFKAGGTLVTVRAGARASEVESILHEFQADLGPTHGYQFASGSPAAMRSHEDTAQTGKGRVRTGETGRGRDIGATEPWDSQERRFHVDANYTGPERRLVNA